MASNGGKSRPKVKLKTEMTKKLTISNCTCPICLYIFIEPVTFPCGHELCNPCFRKHVEQTSLACPLCRLRISVWVRRATKTNSLVNQERWAAIQQAFPEKVQRRLEGREDEEEEEEDEIYQGPLALAEPGEIKQEFEAELEKMRLLNEDTQEVRLSMELIQQLEAKEEKERLQAELQAQQDEELARRLQQELDQAKRQSPLIKKKDLRSAPKEKDTFLDKFLKQEAPTKKVTVPSGVDQSEADMNSSPKSSGQGGPLHKFLRPKLPSLPGDVVFSPKAKENLGDKRNVANSPMDCWLKAKRQVARGGVKTIHNEDGHPGMATSNNCLDTVSKVNSGKDTKQHENFHGELQLNIGKEEKTISDTSSEVYVLTQRSSESNMCHSHSVSDSCNQGNERNKHVATRLQHSVSDRTEFKLVNGTDDTRNSDSALKDAVVEHVEGNNLKPVRRKSLRETAVSQKIKCPYNVEKISMAEESDVPISKKPVVEMKTVTEISEYDQIKTSETRVTEEQMASKDRPLKAMGPSPGKVFMIDKSDEGKLPGHPKIPTRIWKDGETPPRRSPRKHAPMKETIQAIPAETHANVQGPRDESSKYAVLNYVDCVRSKDSYTLVSRDTHLSSSESTKIPNTSLLQVSEENTSKSDVDSLFGSPSTLSNRNKTSTRRRPNKTCTRKRSLVESSSEDSEYESPHKRVRRPLKSVHYFESETESDTENDKCESHKTHTKKNKNTTIKVSLNQSILHYFNKTPNRSSLAKQTKPILTLKENKKMSVSNPTFKVEYSPTDDGKKRRIKRSKTNILPDKKAADISCLPDSRCGEIPEANMTPVKKECHQAGCHACTVKTRGDFSTDGEYKQYIEEQDLLLAQKLQADFDLEAKFSLNAIRRPGSEDEYLLRNRNKAEGE